MVLTPDSYPSDKEITVIQLHKAPRPIAFSLCQNNQVPGGSFTVVRLPIAALSKIFNHFIHCINHKILNLQPGMIIKILKSGLTLAKKH